MLGILGDSIKKATKKLAKETVGDSVEKSVKKTAKELATSTSKNPISKLSSLFDLDKFRASKKAGVAMILPDSSTNRFLPAGYEKLEERLSSPDWLDTQVGNALGKKAEDVTKGDYGSYLALATNNNPTVKDVVGTAKSVADREFADALKSEGSELPNEFMSYRNVGKRGYAKVDNFYIGNKGNTGKLDAEFSKRLGISPSTTPMADRLNGRGGANGDYWGFGIGLPAYKSGDRGISTLGHERLHSFQHNSKYYHPEVNKAMEELNKDFTPFFKSRDEIVKRYGTRSYKYWSKKTEQQARAFQDYLERKGYTNSSRFNNLVNPKGPEFDESVDKVFDKFVDKLRELSKKGIALPASLAGLVGAGAMINSKDGKDNNGYSE